MRAFWVAALVLSLAGCKLIDQTTFAPSPEASAAVVEPPKADKRVALLTIDYDQPNPSYQELLRYAIHTAETRVPGVEYDVIAMLPPKADAAAAQRHAVDVMRDIMAQGVPASRIHLGLRAEQADGPVEVRVYVH